MLIKSKIVSNSPAQSKKNKKDGLTPPTVLALDSCNPGSIKVILIPKKMSWLLALVILIPKKILYLCGK
jgi:hypothetical protein